jgi:hypothetical protein
MIAVTIDAMVTEGAVEATPFGQAVCRRKRVGWHCQFHHQELKVVAAAERVKVPEGNPSRGDSPRRHHASAVAEHGSRAVEASGGVNT